VKQVLTRLKVGEYLGLFIIDLNAEVLLLYRRLLGLTSLLTRTVPVSERNGLDGSTSGLL